MAILPTTLCMAAAAVVVNFWLGLRIGRLRVAHKIFMGDGGNLALIARMRAQANFIEQTPLTLLLFALVELAGGAHSRWGSWGLPVLGAVFMAGRMAHAYGMDGWRPGRPIGMITSTLAQLVLSVCAVMLAVGAL